MDTAYTPTQLADAVGISTPFAWQIMNGKRKPSQAMALRIHAATGMKLGPIAALADDDIATLARILDKQGESA